MHSLQNRGRDKYSLRLQLSNWVDVCSFEDGLRLVKLRGESMQAAADQKPSAMVSVIGLSSEKVFALLHNCGNDWAQLKLHGIRQKRQARRRKLS